METPPETADPALDATLSVTLHGPGVELGTVAAGLVSRYIDAFRLSLQVVVELGEREHPSDSQGRRQRWVERLAALRLVGIDSGSGCVRIRFAEPDWRGLFPDADRTTFTRALDILFAGVSRVGPESSGTPQAAPSLAETVELSDDQRRRLLEALHRLTPPRRGPVRQVSLSRQLPIEAPPVWQTLTLDRRSRDRIQDEIDRLSTRPSRQDPPIDPNPQADPTHLPGLIDNC